MLGVLFTSGIMPVIFLLIDFCNQTIRLMELFLIENIYIYIYISEKENEIRLSIAYLRDICLQRSEEQELAG